MATGAHSMIRGRLKTRHLVLLVHLDEQRSVLRAARAANMTQPGASKLLKEIENSLGVPLFRRHARGVEPTRYGEVMMRRARSALSEIDRAQEEIAALRDGLAGEASIGSVMNPGIKAVPAAVAALKQTNPRVLVRIVIDSSEALAQRLLTEVVAQQIARIPPSHAAGALRFERLANESHRVIARAGHPLARKRHLDLGMLVEYPWVLPPSGSLLRDRIDSMFIQQGLGPPRNVVETSSMPVITSLLQSTDMLSAMEAETIASYRKAQLLAVLSASLSIDMGQFGIITRRDREISPSAGALLESLRAVAARIYAPKSSR